MKLRSTGSSDEQSRGEEQTMREDERKKAIEKGIIMYDSCMSRDGFAIIPRRNRFPPFPSNLRV